MSVFRRKIEGCELVHKEEFDFEAFVLPDGRKCKVLGCGFGIYKRSHRRPQRTQPKLDASDFIDVFTIQKQPGRVCGQGREADRYIIASQFGTRGLRPVKTLEETFANGGNSCYGIKIRREHDAVAEALDSANWPAFARRSLHGHYRITIECIHAALTWAGFRNDGLPLEFHSVNAASGAGLKKGESYDRFIRRSTYQSVVRKEGGIRTLRKPPANAAIALRVREDVEDREDLLRRIDSIDFHPYGRRSVSTSTELDLAAAQKALADELVGEVWLVNRSRGIGLEERPGAIYFPHYCNEGSLAKGYLRAYDSIITNEMIGVRASRRVIGRLRSLRPGQLGRRSTNGAVAVSIASIREAMARPNEGIEVFYVDHKHPTWARRDECDLFLPTGTYYGCEDKIRAYDQPPAKCCFGVVLKEDRDRLLAWARDFDWAAIAKRQTNRNLNLRRDDVVREFERA